MFLLYYHLVLVIKYRKEVFDHIAPDYNITLVEWNHDVDHVHILFKAYPHSSLSKFINAYKSASSRLLKKEFLEYSQKIVERIFLVKKLLPAESRRCTHRGHQGIYRKSGWET